MHLVDLAGSERVSKTQILGTILNEAKHINLSLHFLEQVIICLQVPASQTAVTGARAVMLAPALPLSC